MIVVNRFLTSFFQGSGETHPSVLGFIVLSGYCIHRNGFRDEPLEIKEYAVRRFFRIFPVYGSAIVLGMIGFELNKSISAAVTSALSGTIHLGFWQVLGKISGVSAFLPFLHQQTMQGNAPLHTVMVECWLYVMYPLAIGFFLKRGREVFLWSAIICVWVLGMLVIILKPSWIGWWHNGSLFSFLMYWWIGAKCLDIKFTKKIFKILPACLLAWIFLSIANYFGKLHFILIVEIKKISYCFIFASIISYFDMFKGNASIKENKARVGSLLSQSLWKIPGLMIGRSSYSLYAFHAPVVQLFILNEMGAFAALTASILCGLIMFETLEKPMIGFGKRIFPFSPKAPLIDAG